VFFLRRSHANPQFVADPKVISAKAPRRNAACPFGKAA